MRRRQFSLWQILGLIAVLALVTFGERGMRGVQEPVVDRVEGYPRLIDGDSFRMDGHEVRLQGIDAPEGRQICKRDGKDWSCGEASREKFSQLIRDKPVVCEVKGRDKHLRLLAYCSVGGELLNRRMVEEGFAVSFGREYHAEERRAKDSKRGLWASEFERPQDWRRKHLGSVD